MVERIRYDRSLVNFNENVECCIIYAMQEHNTLLNWEFCFFETVCQSRWESSARPVIQSFLHSNLVHRVLLLGLNLLHHLQHDITEITLMYFCLTAWKNSKINAKIKTTNKMRNLDLLFVHIPFLSVYNRKKWDTAIFSRALVYCLWKKQYFQNVPFVTYIILVRNIAIK